MLCVCVASVHVRTSEEEDTSVYEKHSLRAPPTYEATGPWPARGPVGARRCGAHRDTRQFEHWSDTLTSGHIAARPVSCSDSGRKPCPKRKPADESGGEPLTSHARARRTRTMPSSARAQSHSSRSVPPHQSHALPCPVTPPPRGVAIHTARLLNRATS